MASRTRTLAILASLAFVALGLPDGLLGVAWPSMRVGFGLPLDAIAPLLAAFTLGYVSASLAGGRLLARLGLGALLVASCLATGLSLLGYALAPTWPIVVGCGAVAGLGAGGIDAGINTYAAERHGAGMLNWLHACYGVGAAGGPAVMSSVLLADLPWQTGYAIVGAAQLALAAAFVATASSWGGAASADAPAPARARLGATLALPAMRLAVAIFVLYTGLELAIGTWAYSVLTEGRGVAMGTAGLSIAGYWVGLTSGRVLGALAVRRVGVAGVLRGAVATLAGALAVFALVPAPGAGLAALALAGVAAGPIFPSLIATTPARVGAPHAPNAIGVQIAAAALGQAMVPALLGVLGDELGLDALTAGLVVLACAVAALVVAPARGGGAALSLAPAAPMAAAAPAPVSAPPRADRTPGRRGGRRRPRPRSPRP